MVTMIFSIWYLKQQENISQKEIIFRCGIACDFTDMLQSLYFHVIFY